MIGLAFLAAVLGAVVTFLVCMWTKPKSKHAYAKSIMLGGFLGVMIILLLYVIYQLTALAWRILQ